MTPLTCPPLGAPTDAKSSPARTIKDDHRKSSHLAIHAAVETVVGRMSLGDALALFRSAMVDLALARQQGSRRAAAKMLGVTRPAVQHILRLSKVSTPSVLLPGKTASNLQKD